MEVNIKLDENTTSNSLLVCTTYDKKNNIAYARNIKYRNDLDKALVKIEYVFDRGEFRKLKLDCATNIKSNVNCKGCLYYLKPLENPVNSAIISVVE
jgi:hypothetical protein